MLKPTYEIQIGSETFGPKTTSDVISVRINLDMDTPADSFETVFMASDKSSEIRKEDDVSISLGYEENLVKVFMGTVDIVEPTFPKIAVTGLSLTLRLLDLRVNQVYENQSAGNIVSDLASRANLVTGEVSDGLLFPIYVIDDTKNAYEHIHDLAEKCGFDGYMTSDNELVFKKYERKNSHIFEYGKDIIHAEVNDQTPMRFRISVRGESPSSFKGADTSHWLTKREVEGFAGNGAELSIQDPTVKDKDTAEKVAKAKLDALERSLSGTVKAIGRAEVKLGETIEVKGMPNEKLNGEFQVRSIEHSLNKTEGFITTIGWRK
jgi:phage protein D